MRQSLIVGLFFFLYINALQARTKSLPERKITVTAANIEQRIDELLARPEAVLMRYKPVGMTVRNKKVTGNIIEFEATKSVLGISKTVFYRGTLTLNVTKDQTNVRCFTATQDFDGSGELIYDSVTKFELFICAEIINNANAKATITPKLTEGRNPGGLFGSIATDLIIDQIDPVILAIKEELQRK